MTTLQPNQIIGTYRIVRPLGQGGEESVGSHEAPSDRRYADGHVGVRDEPRRRVGFADDDRNERGEYELHEIEMLPTPSAARHLRGFLFERGGRRVVAYWHTCAEGDLEWTLGARERVANLTYRSTDLSRDAVKAAWSSARLTDVTSASLPL